MILSSSAALGGCIFFGVGLVFGEYKAPIFKYMMTKKAIDSLYHLEIKLSQT